MLVDFFRSPASSNLGDDGDLSNLTPAQTAIRAMRELIELRHRIAGLEK